MTRLFAIAILIAALSGCVTSDGLYNRPAAISSQVVPAARQPLRQPQTAQQRQRVQVSMQQRARGPLIRRAEYPIMLGVAF